MKKYLIILVIALTGCVAINSTYVRQGQLYKPIDSIQFATIKNHHNISDDADTQISVTNTSSTPIEGVISGYLLKNGISTISSAQLSKLNNSQLSKCLIVEWGVSGRNSRGIIGYSQEVTILMRNALSGELVYKGIGEYMGRTEKDDLKGALLAALTNFK